MYAKNKTSAYRNTDLKRIAAITCMVLLFVLLFSITYISLESDHDCCGEDCHICECLEACGKTLSLIRCGSGRPMPQIRKHTVQMLHLIPISSTHSIRNMPIW